jgi:predicted glycoside hydrolase/deacetylase ChbG (UPF0249 family)
MLIVNADDFGITRNATDSIASCYRAGRISSTTAMVFMDDSARAVGVAADLAMNVGLHVNFSQAFTGERIPPRLRERQRRLSDFLNGGRLRPLLFNPRLCGHFEYVFWHQLDEFERLYGRQPTHVDGHHHMHLCTNMLMQNVIPRGTRIRTTFSSFPGERGALHRLIRRGVHRRVASRYRAPGALFSLSTVMTRPERRVGRLRAIVALTVVEPVELMTHPEWQHERDYLMSDEYTQIVPRSAMSSYASL